MDISTINNQVNLFIEKLEGVLDVALSPEQIMSIKSLVIENIQATLDSLKGIMDEL